MDIKPTKRFLCRFYGRRRGALGISYTIEVTVEAECAKAAALKLYDNYEHISMFRDYPKEISQGDPRG
jgi:hypothetical protein